MRSQPGKSFDEQLHDAGVVLAVHQQIQTLAEQLRHNPLDAAVGARMRLLLTGSSIEAARQALARLGASADNDTDSVETGLPLLVFIDEAGECMRDLDRFPRIADIEAFTPKALPASEKYRRGESA
ncbi:hypothetical protein AB0N05_37630 [Nocardia sp. NPDC051030]|uniref:hypothetical protein n=1 Tax=Nocardia sp. NPDC051030 TaxID=3155162 RepID=UPI00341B94C2